MERRAAAEAGVEESASDASGPRDAHPHARARSSGGRSLEAWARMRAHVLISERVEGAGARRPWWEHCCWTRLWVLKVGVVAYCSCESMLARLAWRVP